MAGGQALDGSRTAAFRMDCFDIKVPGLDKVRGSFGPPELIKAHEGRLDLGKRGLWKPGFVESIVADDVWETVVTWKDANDTPWAVDGVQRILGGREAATIRKERGDKRPVLIPTLSPVGKIDDVQRFALSLKLNHLRHDDPPLVEAAKMAELYKMAKGSIVNGRERTEAEAVALVAQAVGKRPDVVREGLKLDAAQADIKREVHGRTLTPTAATALQALPTDQQQGVLDKVRSTGAASASCVKEAVRTHKATSDGHDPDDAVVTPSKPTIRRVFEHEKAEEVLRNATGYDVMRWILGEASPRVVTGLSPIVREVTGG